MVSEAATVAIQAFAEDGFNNWKNSASQEQKDAGVAELMKYTTDPEYAGAQMTQCQAAFASSDADSDGLLNAEEFAVFDGKMSAAAIAKQ